MFPWIGLQRELWGFSRDRRRIQRTYAAKYAAAEKEGKSKDDLWAVLEDKSREDKYVDESIIAAETSYLFEIAYHLRIPMPEYTNKELWVETSYLGRRLLADKALADFRTAIRKEQNERWRYIDLRLKVLGVILTGLTGTIGALIGLVAIYKK